MQINEIYVKLDTLAEQIARLAQKIDKLIALLES